MKDQRFLKCLLLLCIILSITAFYYFGADRFLTLSFVKSRLDDVQALYAHRPLMVVSLFCLIYISLGALSIPGSIVLTLLSGAIFGLGMGTALVMTSGTLGATIAFLMARYLFRDTMSRRFKRQYAAIEEKMKVEGKMYLLIMRMIPISPFVVINNVMGLTSMGVMTFFIITFLGMLPGTFIYIYAGQKISQIESVGEIMSWPILLSLTLIGIFPLIVKKILAVYRRRHHLGALT